MQAPPVQLTFEDQGLKKLPQGAVTGIDLFAGAGGFSLGMSQGGIFVVGAVEHDKACCWTLRANAKKAFPLITVIEEDIRNLTGESLLKKCGVNQLDILFGGPPCQGFSMANARSRGLDDPRSKLMAEFVRMVREIKPKVFLIENVPGLLTFKDFFIMLMTELEECGYEVRFNKLNAAGYGVPQNRIRIFIHGDRKDTGKIPSWPVYTHFNEPEDKQGNIKELWPTAASVMTELFPVNGFTKEQVKHVRYNNTLDILMDDRTAADDLDQAVNRIIFKGILNNIDQSPVKP